MILERQALLVKEIYLPESTEAFEKRQIFETVQFWGIIYKEKGGSCDLEDGKSGVEEVGWGKVWFFPVGSGKGLSQSCPVVFGTGSGTGQFWTKDISGNTITPKALPQPFLLKNTQLTDFSKKKYSSIFLFAVKKVTTRVTTKSFISQYLGHISDFFDENFRIFSKWHEPYARGIDFFALAHSVR